MKTTSSIYSALYAVLDTAYWGMDEILMWSDKMLIKLENPPVWLMDLSCSNSVKGALAVLQNEMKQSATMLDDRFEILLVGFVLLKFDEGNLTLDDAKTQIADIVDSYDGQPFDVEMLERLNLDEAVCKKCRNMALLTITLLNKLELF